MPITFDPRKRDWTLETRGIDFLDAGIVWTGPGPSFEDDREDYGERRISTVGRLAGLHDRLRASGPGWQGRVNKALRAWVDDRATDRR